MTGKVFKNNNIDFKNNFNWLNIFELRINIRKIIFNEYLKNIRKIYINEYEWLLTLFIQYIIYI